MASKTRVSVDEGIEFSQYVSFAGTQSGANAFLQLTIPTNITPNGGVIWDIDEIVVMLDTVSGISTAAPIVDFCMTRATKAAMPSLNDKDVIARSKIASFGVGAPTVAGVGVVEMPINLAYSGKQIIAATDVYLQMTTSGFSGAMSISGRIYFSTIAMAKDRILEVLYG
jgi:hypothetical protein